MDFYTQGVLIAFFIGVIKVFSSINYVFSLKARNLRKIGLHYRFLDANFTSATPPTFTKFIGYSIYILILAPIFSWLSVLSAGWTAVNWWSHRSSLPEKMREVLFKVSNLDLSTEQMAEIRDELEKSMKLSTGPTTIDQPKHSSNSLESPFQDDDDTLVLENGDWYADVSLDRSNKKLHFNSHPPDYDGIRDSVYEYRFDSENLMTRLIADKVKYWSEEYWHVKDGVVLESEIRKKCAANRFMDFDEHCNRYNSEVQWHPIKQYNIVYWVMSKHSELFSRQEWRRIVRKELERIRNGKLKAIAKATEAGLVVVNVEDGISFRYPDNFPEEKKQTLKPEFLDSTGITFEELFYFSKHESELMRLLGETVAA